MRLIKPDHKNHPLGRDIVTNNYARLGSHRIPVRLTPNFFTSCASISIDICFYHDSIIL